jgi:hypothetical protein
VLVAGLLAPSPHPPCVTTTQHIVSTVRKVASAIERVINNSFERRGDGRPQRSAAARTSINLVESGKRQDLGVQSLGRARGL